MAATTMSGACRQRVEVQAADGAGQLGVLRDHVGRVAALDAAPGDREPGAGVDPAPDQRGHVGDHAGGRRDQVGGEVRAGGVAAGPVQGDLQPVAGGGDRALAQTDPARVDPGVAVHGDDPADAVQRAVLDGVGGAAGQHLLGGLEDQPHRARQQALAVQLGQDQPGAEDDGGVHVVAAGVRAVGRRSTGRRTRSWCPGWAARRCRRAWPARGAAAAPTVPMSQMRPVPTASTRGSSPAFSRRALIAAVVRNSWLPSSGCMCRSRRKATSSARSASGRTPGRAVFPGGSASDSRDISCFTL